MFLTGFKITVWSRMVARFISGELTSVIGSQRKELNLVLLFDGVSHGRASLSNVQRGLNARFAFNLFYHCS